MTRDYAGRYTHTSPNGNRTWRLYGCARRGCDRINLDFEAFGGRNDKSYCKLHIPLRSQVIVELQERGWWVTPGMKYRSLRQALVWLRRIANRYYIDFDNAVESSRKSA